MEADPGQRIYSVAAGFSVKHFSASCTHSGSLGIYAFFKRGLPFQREEPHSEWVFEGEVERPAEFVERSRSPANPGMVIELICPYYSE